MEQYPVDRIIVGDRIRKALPVDVAAIRQSFATEGQLQPIVLRKLPDGTARLVAGLHRLEAARLEKWATIGAVYFVETGNAELDALREGIAECDENMKRVELGIERAKFTARRAYLTAQCVAVRAAIEARAEAERAEEARKTATTYGERESARKTVLKRSSTAEAAQKRAEVFAEAAKTLVRPRVSRPHADQGRTGVSNAPPDRPTKPVQGRTALKLPPSVLDAVSKETGLSAVTVRHDLALLDKFGPDVISLAHKTKLGVDYAGTQSEMSALAKLLKEYPDSYKLTINSWRKHAEGKGYPHRPSTVLRECRMKDTDTTKKASGHSGILRQGAISLVALRSKLIETRNAVTQAKAANLRAFETDMRLMAEKLQTHAVFLRELAAKADTATDEARRLAKSTLQSRQPRFAK